MIKATIQNIPYCTEIVFPCTETELSKKLGELGMNPEHLAPMAMVLEIEPSELSVLTDCDVSLDALNYLGKRLDGMDKLERKQFLAVLSCDEADIGYGLKNIINLTDNLARFTLIEDTDDLERIGRIHMLNVRGGLSESEYQNKEWLVTEGKKLLESGTGIDTEYGKLYIIAVILLPFILLILMIAGMVSGVESANNDLLDYSFAETAMPDNFTDEQRGVIENMREWLGELDENISEKENDEERSLDGNMVRAAFYCLNFGAELDEEFDYGAFCDCFDGLTIEQLETALQNVSEQFPQYEITENIRYSIPIVYEYLIGKE